MFYADEDMMRKGSYKLRMEIEMYDEFTKNGPVNTSFNIVPSRLLGLDYPDFLLYIYQTFGAAIHDRGAKYASYSFDNKAKLNELIKLLDSKWIEIYG